MGLLGITVPESEGGLGKGYLDHTIVMEGEGRNAYRWPGPNLNISNAAYPNLPAFP